MPFMKRTVIIILDGVGIGALPDAGEYGDVGTNTLSHVINAVPGLRLPNLASLGLGRIRGVVGVPEAASPQASFGRMAEKSKGKDSTTGHWELAGLVVEKAHPTYPDGFPGDVIEAFEKAIGRGTLGNIPASGTEIIASLGDEHLRTGRPIVYTSADSVFQVAVHHDVMTEEELYRACRIARGLLKGDHAVCRVIARPFEGRSGQYVRTAGRKDFSLPPPGPTLFDRAEEAGMSVLAIGKVFDLYAGSGIELHWSAKGNTEIIEKIIEALGRDEAAIIIANLVDFDMLYGHRNDPKGFAKALKEFDDAVPDILERLRDADLFMITADHGNDPTTPGTDHTREYVPLLVGGPAFKKGRDLGTRGSFADAGATAAEFLGLPRLGAGRSFLGEITKGQRV